MLPGRQPERALFPGVVPIGLAAAGLAPAARRACASPTSPGLLVAFDGSLGFNGLTYPLSLQLVFADPRAARARARSAFWSALSLAVLAGFGVRRLLASVRRTRTASLAFGAAVIASVVNVWPVLPLRPVWSDPPPVYGALSGARDVVLAEFPVANDYVFNTQVHVLRAAGTGRR